MTALWSPSTGILDSHSYMLALQGDAEERGAMLAFYTPVESGRIEEDGIVLTTGGDAPMTLKAKTVVNAGGLHARPLAASLSGFPSDKVPPHHYCKGNYYTLSGMRAPFSHLIYPAPEQAGLGIHLTLDLAGQARFGPDVEWIDSIDYDVDPAGPTASTPPCESIGRAFPTARFNPAMPASARKSRPKASPPRTSWFTAPKTTVCWAW